MRRAAKPYLLLLAAGIATHGLLLLGDGTFWDDWLWTAYLREGRWDFLAASFEEMGLLPISARFFWAFRDLPDPSTGFHVASALAAIGSAMVLLRLLRQVVGLAPGVAFAVALLALTYPAFEARALGCNAHYDFYYFLYLAGACLALVSEDATGTRRLLSRLAGAGLMFLGFSLRSLLVLHFGFLLLLAVRLHRRRGLSLREILLRAAPRRADLVLLPFIFWVVKEVFFPRHGYYANYNRFNPLGAPMAALFFLGDSILGHLDAALVGLLAQPLLWALTAIVLVRLTPKLAPSLATAAPGATSQASPGTTPAALVRFGLVLLGLAIFPYAVVGLRPALHGADTRHAILIGVPMALVLVGSILTLFPGTAGAPSRAGVVVLGSLALAFCLSNVRNYVSWQARSVKDRSVLAKLGRLPPEARAASVYVVDDQYPIVGVPLPYDFVEWSCMLHSLWGGQSRIGLRDPAELPQRKPFFTERYYLRDLDPAGARARIVIKRGWYPYDESGLAFRYLFYRFVAPEKMAEFLERVTEVTVTPIR